MPCALPIAGLQHICDNTNKDTHESLLFWDEYHAGLKQYEVLFRTPGLRDRYLWTCVRGGAHEYLTAHIQDWSHSLYEKRWREVVAFTKDLIKILAGVHATWDKEKFTRGVDCYNEITKAIPLQRREGLRRAGVHSNRTEHTSFIVHCNDHSYGWSFNQDRKIWRDMPVP